MMAGEMVAIPKQLLPLLATYDYEALRDDIERRGVIVPVIVNKATGEIIDGHHRVQIAEELGIEYPVEAVDIEDMAEARIIAVGLNVKRRRLSLEQRQELARALRGDGWTQQEVADALGVSRPTVSEWLKEKMEGDTTNVRTDVGCTPRANAKLSNEQKQEIYERAQAGETQTALAADYSVSQQAIHKALKSTARKYEREAAIEEQRAAIEAGAVGLPEGVFEVITMDPPWNYGREYDPDASRVANPYPEMTQDQLLELEPPFAEDCVLFLWTTHQFIWDAKELLDHWGFQYKATMVWDKEKIGMGKWLRMQVEFCLVGIKGAPTWSNTTWRDIIREPRREHSRKPETFYRMVEEITVGRRLDFFSREARDGWEAFGNDTAKF